MIGIFDSGVGGLTVVKQIKESLPQHKIIYFGDTARVPYGNKSAEMIKKYAEQDLDFLLGKGAKIIVIACHTASALAGEYLREKHLDVPIFDVVKPGLDMASEVTRNHKIGIIGTEGTVKSGVHAEYLKGVNPEIETFYQACPLLVPLAEEGWIKRPETKKIVRYYLRSLKKESIDTLVLACTHYPLLADVIQAAAGKSVKVIDPACEVAKQLSEYLDSNPDLLGKSQGDDQYYVSDVSDKFQDIGEKILGEKMLVQLANVT